jgi:protein SCO1/2
MKVSTAIFSLLFCSLLLGPMTAVAIDERRAPMPAEMKARGTEGIGITENLGGKLTLSMPVIDENGQTRQLAEYFHSGRPVIFSLIYFSCPGLCNYHMNGLVEALKGLDWNPGDKFEVVALSFDPKEGAALAAAKKLNYVSLYERPDAGQKGMHFLTASQETIDQLTKDIGFKYRWDAASNEWAHASAAVMISPDGKITRYLHGIMFDAKDVKLALSESTEGKIGTIVDKMIWYCFMYDPKQSKYTIAAFRLVQLGGALIILVVAALLVPQWLKARQTKV